MSIMSCTAKRENKNIIKFCCGDDDDGNDGTMVVVVVNAIRSTRVASTTITIVANFVVSISRHFIYFRFFSCTPCDVT